MATPSRLPTVRSLRPHRPNLPCRSRGRPTARTPMLSLTSVDALPTARFRQVDRSLIAIDYQQLTPLNDLWQNGGREVLARLGFRSRPFPLAGNPTDWDHFTAPATRRGNEQARFWLGAPYPATVPHPLREVRLFLYGEADDQRKESGASEYFPLLIPS